MNPSRMQEAREVLARIEEWVGSTGTAVVEGPCWRLSPADAAASPLWVCGEGAWDLTVGFGRASARMELGYTDKITTAEQLDDLEDICRSVIEGRLVEKRRGRRGSAWRLTLTSGKMTHGTANWPPVPWMRTVEQEFRPYQAVS